MHAIAAPTQLASVKFFSIDDVFDGWAQAQKTRFKDGGSFDQIYRPGK